jgi:FkbM family methyltransferase
LDYIQRILTRPELADDPPVLVEIGASGGTHGAWKALAPYSIAIAFDPDSREMQAVHAESRGYRRLCVIPAAAVAEQAAETEFYLTRSPQCSSLLEPDGSSLADWEFARLFDVASKARVPCVRIADALASAGVARVDWFKTDSQGIDLRLFLSLDEALRRRVLAAEFEPGIIDAYKGEDKLWSVLASMDRRDFWLARMRVRGTLRIHQDDAQRLSPGDPEALGAALPRTPGWTELTYLNTFRGAGPFTDRDRMLGWTIACLHDQFGFALELAARARLASTDPIFDELHAHAERQIVARLRRGKPGRFLRHTLRRLRSTAGRILKPRTRTD